MTIFPLPCCLFIQPIVKQKSHYLAHRDHSSMDLAAALFFVQMLMPEI
jgi:hypothetical protein